MDEQREEFLAEPPLEWMIREENFGRASLWVNLRSEKKERMLKERFGLRW